CARDNSNYLGRFDVW
nr:immunoglobulin heavy chain junction region [Macaca mulatta]